MRATSFRCADEAGVCDSGFVQIGGTGAPQLLCLYQDWSVGRTAKTLTKGALWRSIGVTSSVGSNTTRRFNADNHGSLIGKARYLSVCARRDGWVGEHRHGLGSPSRPSSAFAADVTRDGLRGQRHGR
jgi:hypothetical protein